MAAGPQFDNSAVIPASTTQSFTVNNNVRRIMVVWGSGTLHFPNDITQDLTPPSITYGGQSFTFPLYPATNNNFQILPGISSQYMGYIINPTVGAANVVNSSSSQATVAVFYDVDQNTPFDAFQSSSASQTTIDPYPCFITTNRDNSILLKSSNIVFSNSGVSDGPGETTIVPSEPGFNSWKPTTTAGNYTVATGWNPNQAASNYVAIQAVELRWGGVLSATASATTANSSARTQTVTRAIHNFRTFIATTANSAGRLSSPSRFFSAIVSVLTGNSASRHITVSALFKAGWHIVTKSVSNWVNVPVTQDNIVYATAGLYKGFGAFTYSGGEVLYAGNIPIYSNQQKSVSSWTNQIKS